jgi:hypothetical protein
VVTVAVPPPVALMPVNDGMEKYVLAHASGAGRPLGGIVGQRDGVQ